jgi:hypothetical protein
MGCNPSQAAVDHAADAFDGDRRLSDVRREDELSVGGRLDNQVLLGGGEISVQRQHHPCASASEFGAGFCGASNLRRSGKKDEQVPAFAGRGQPLQSRQDLLLQWAAIGCGEVLDLDLERPARTVKHRAPAEVSGDLVYIERRRHDDELQIVPRPELKAAKKRETNVAREVTLVKFVQHHGTHAREKWIRDQPPLQYAFGHEAQARSSACHFFEPDLIPDGFAERLAQLLGNASSRQPRSEATRLQDDDFAFRGAVLP